MKTIPFADIIIPDTRQRRSFDSNAHQELQASIRSKGLLHPIVLRTFEHPILVAGERRLRALMALNWELIPVTYLGELTDLQYEEAELEENVLRMDLSWQEKAHAIDRLHKLRQQQNPSHTAKETVEEILGRTALPGQSTSIIRDNQILASFLADPEVAAAKSKSDAMKLIKRKVAAVERERLSKEASALRSSHTHILGDCREELLTLPDDTYTCLITDPPYGIGADTFGDQSAVGHHYKDTEENAFNIYEAILGEGFRICKKEAHLYMFCDIRHFQALGYLAESKGWYIWQTPIIWQKRSNQGMLPRPEHGPRRSCECIMYCIKGDKRVTGVYPDVLDIPAIHAPEHAAAKPSSLYANLLSRSCLPGDHILDPCAGSGPIFPAANSLQLIATAINLDEADYHFANSRLEERLE